MPALHVGAAHVASDAHCAVCKEAFELGAEAREMPCALKVA
jgi:E3 ubiquitin-protein ligase RNF115/126